MFGCVLQERRLPDTRLPADDQRGATREPCGVQKTSQGCTVPFPAVQHPNKSISVAIAPTLLQAWQGIAR